MPTGVELATAWVRIVPTVQGVQGEVAKALAPAEAEAAKSGDKSGKKWGAGWGKAAGVVALAGVAALTAGIVKVFNTGIEELKFGEQVNAQSKVLLKNTDFKMSVKQINDFTLALSKVSGVSEEELQAAGNNLLKFGNLSEENYKKAVASINDLAASGKDAAGVSEGLGKALADPAKGASLLRRQGIQLTAQQQEQIKAFTEAGDKAAAQGVILDALEGTYGGMAEAAGGTLQGNLNKLNNAFENLSGDLVQSAMPAIEGVVGFLQDMVGFLQENQMVLPIVAGIIGVTLVAAFVAWAASVWAANAALLANPITWVVLAIVALVAAIVWVATQTTFFQDVWDGAMKVIGAVADWLWTRVLKPVFNAIGAVVNWVWTSVLKPVVDLIVNAFRFWGAVANWLWAEVVSPVFKAIGDVFRWIWREVIEPVVKWIREKLDLLGLAFRVLYELFIRPAFEGIKSVVDTVWRWIDQNVFTPFKTGIGLIGKAFENTAKAIGVAWGGIKKAAAVPINFVLDTVWNKGLRSFWNDMVTNLGLKDMKLPEAKLVKFANGGVESHVAQIARGGAMRLWAEPETGGEAYIPLAPSKRGRSTAILGEVARRFGYGLTQYKDGGFFDTVGSFAGDIWENVKGVASVIGDFFADPVGAVQKHVVEGIIDPLLGGAGDSVFARTVGALPAMAVKRLAKMLTPPSRGTKGMGWQAMWDVVKSAVPGAVMTSGYRSPSANSAAGGVKGSYHTQGRAIDIVPASMATFDAIARLFPNASELIYTPAGSRQLLNGKPFNGWSDYVKRIHHNHVHLAMAEGGLLPGLATGGTITRAGHVVVGENGPEILRLPRGAQVDPDIAGYDGDRTVVFKNYAPLGQSPAQALTEFSNRAKGL